MLIATPSGALYAGMDRKRRTGSSSEGVLDGGDHLGDQAYAQFLAGVLHPEGTDRRAAQVGAVGVLEGLDQGPDVGADRALDRVAGRLPVAPQQLRR